LNSPLKIGAPEVVLARGAGRQAACRSPGAGGAPRDLDQAVPVEHGVDRALGRNADVAVQSADQELTGSCGHPQWGLFALGRDDQALDLPTAAGWRSEPAGANGRSRPRGRVPCSARRSCSRSLREIAERRDRPSLIASPSSSRATNRRALVHHRTLLPRHRHLPRKRGKVLPMCPVRSVTYVLGRLTSANQSFGWWSDPYFPAALRSTRCQPPRFQSVTAVGAPRIFRPVLWCRADALFGPRLMQRARYREPAVDLGF